MINIFRLRYSIFIPVLLVIIVLLQDHASAQRKEDVIYLSNGSIIHGTLLEDSIRTKVRIINHAGDIWAFDHDEVDSVKHERYFEYRSGIFSQPGFEFNINGEFLMRSRNNAVGKAVIPGLTMQFAYRIKPAFSAGFETGMEFYEWMEIPMAACLTFRTSRRSLSPLLFIRGGFTLPAEKRGDDNDYSYKSFGGNHVSTGIGIERILSENASFLFSFSYHFQTLRYHLTPLHQWVQERDRTETYNRFRLSLGYVFK